MLVGGKGHTRVWVKPVNMFILITLKPFLSMPFEVNYVYSGECDLWSSLMTFEMVIGDKLHMVKQGHKTFFEDQLGNH